MMTSQERIAKHISLLKFKDPRVIQHIVNHPILFAKCIMASPDDYRPVRIRYFGTFTQKYMYNKEVFSKFKSLCKWFKEYPESTKLIGCDTYEEAYTCIRKLLDDQDKDEMLTLYDIVSKAIHDKENLIVPKIKRNKKVKNTLQ